MKTFSKKICEETKKSKLIVYGTGAVGEIAYYALKSWGREPDFFCDHDPNKRQFFNIDVLQPEELTNIKDVVIIIAFKDFLRSAVRILRQQGISNYYSMLDLIGLDIDKSLLSISAQEFLVRKGNYDELLNHAEDDNWICIQQALLYLEKYVSGLIDAGATGIIVSCPEMIDVVRRNGGNPVVSCVGTVYNSASVRYFQELGAVRIIVPRDLKMEEIAKMKNEVPNMEFETFIMRNGCILSDGNCLGLHQFEHGGICNDIRKSEKRFMVADEHDRNKLVETQKKYDACLYKHACALCGIYRMIQIGIDACKMVGRVDRPDQVLEDMKIVSENRKIAMQCWNENEYFEKMIIPDDHENICKLGYSCYFPEIINPKLSLQIKSQG